MSLPGALFQQLQDVLCTVFNEDGLHQMVRIHLDAALEEISLGSNLRAVSADLIEWADANGWLALSVSAHFIPTSFAKLGEYGFGGERRVEQIEVDDLRAAVARYKRLVILGEPGAGKTTTLWRLLYDYAVEAQNNPAAPIPVLAALGGYSGGETALAYVAGCCPALAPNLPAYLASGRIVLLLDALNEMLRLGYGERVGRIQALLTQFPRPPVVVTCRALDYVEKLQLEKLEVKPLDVERQRAYLHRYLGELEGEKLFWQLAGGAAVGELWSKWQEAGGTWTEFWTAEKMPDAVYSRTTGAQDSLWQKLRATSLPPLLALGMNPFLLVMFTQVYAGQGVLPQNRGKLFAAFVATLLERERQRREQESWPGAATLCHGLAALAYAMQQAGEHGTAVERTWAVAQVATAGCDATEVIYLGTSASLLDATDHQVRFVHQLIQEYLAALAWQEKVAAGEDLSAYWPAGWLTPTGWEETAILLAGILPDMTPLVDALRAVNPPLAARCIGESGGERPGVACVSKLQATLVDIATDADAPVLERSGAGDALNFVGDPRSGVGVRPDALPDIEWVEIPETDVRGRREFIYQEDKRRNEPTFWIARYPVTYRQFQAFIDAGGFAPNAPWWESLSVPDEQRSQPYSQYFVFDNHPRENVSWYQAVAFCRWLTMQAQTYVDLLPVTVRQRAAAARITLPTEWQWEKVARGWEGREYPWGNEYQAGFANINETHGGVGPNHLEQASAVGIYPQGVSPFGVLDMSGNVWEWALNEYEYPAKTGMEGSASRVVRGGSWFNYPHNATAVGRIRYRPDDHGNLDGFRVVCAVPVP